MMSSALIWGFLADTFGRKKLLVVGYALHAVCVIVLGLSQSYEMLLVLKFITGLA